MESYFSFLLIVHSHYWLLYSFSLFLGLYTNIQCFWISVFSLKVEFLFMRSILSALEEEWEARIQKPPNWKRDSWPSWLSCLQFFKCARMLDVCYVKVNVDPTKQFLMTSLPNLENDTNKSQTVSQHSNNWWKQERSCCHLAPHQFNWMNTHSPGLEEVRLHQAEWSGMCWVSGIADGR